jgi:hypothetical protein
MIHNTGSISLFEDKTRRRKLAVEEGTSSYLQSQQDLPDRQAGRREGEREAFEGG